MSQPIIPAAHPHPTNFELTCTFHQAIGQPPPPQPTPHVPTRIISLRWRLLHEEATEALAALDDLRHHPSPATLAALAKELADVLCVTYGTGCAFGLPMDQLYAEVHRSNMTKAGGPTRADGKALKGPNYQPADLTTIIATHTTTTTTPPATLQEVAR